MLVLWPSVHLCACLSLAAFPQYCTDLDVSWGMEGGALWLCTIGRSCNRCTGFVAIWQHSAEHEMSASACTRSMPGAVTRSRCDEIFNYHFNRNLLLSLLVKEPGKSNIIRQSEIQEFSRTFSSGNGPCMSQVNRDLCSGTCRCYTVFYNLIFT